MVMCYAKRFGVLSEERSSAFVEAMGPVNQPSLVRFIAPTKAELRYRLFSSPKRFA